MKQISIKLMTCLALVQLTVSCGMFGDKQPEYYAAQEAQPLEVPPHLDRPTSTSALLILRDPIPLPPGEADTSPPRIWSTSTDGTDNAQFSWSAEGVYLLVEDTPESVQRRLGFVLERAGMVMLDPGAEGNHRFEYWQVSAQKSFWGKMAFWRDEGYDYSGAYQTITRRDGANTRVYVKYADGTECGPDAAEHVLEILRERLG